MKQAKESVAHLFIRLAYENHKLKGRDQARMRMREIGNLAVTIGLEFNENDYEFYRRQADHDGEWFYAQAIRWRNKSAIAAFEKYAKRKPYRFDNVDTHLHHRIKGSSPRARERLAMGFCFAWKGEGVTVTSIVDMPDEDKSYLVACSYKAKVYDEHGYGGPAKIKRRYKITHADLVKEHKKLQGESNAPNKL